VAEPPGDRDEQRLPILRGGPVPAALKPDDAAIEIYVRLEDAAHHALSHRGEERGGDDVEVLPVKL